MIGEQTRLINRIRAILARFGIRSFRLSLRNAADRLIAIRIAEGMPLLDNTRAECTACLSDSTSSVRRSAPSSATACVGSPRLRLHQEARMRWCASSHGSSASVSRRRTCWSLGILSRGLPDRRAVARYAGLTGSPDESGKRRREKGLARAGSARVRHGMIQLAWRFLLF